MLKHSPCFSSFALLLSIQLQPPKSVFTTKSNQVSPAHNPPTAPHFPQERAKALQWPMKPCVILLYMVFQKLYLREGWGMQASRPPASVTYKSCLDCKRHLKYGVVSF